MARARQTDQWNHTSEVLAALANGFSTDGGYKATDFHPDHLAPISQAPRKTSFSARYFAIQLCGQKAVKLFEENEKKHGRRS